MSGFTIQIRTADGRQVINTDFFECIVDSDEKRIVVSAFMADEQPPEHPVMEVADNHRADVHRKFYRLESDA